MKRIVLVAVLVAAPLIAPLIAAAQPPEDAWWSRVAAQNAANLAAPQPYFQTTALKNTIYFATLYRGRIDLSTSVAPLRAICDSQSDGPTRTLALAALQSIGTPEALAYLDRHATTGENNEARALIAEVLNEQYRQRLSML